MKKLLLAIVMAMAFAINLQAQVVWEIGDENSTQTFYGAPVYFNYNYSYTQTLYLQTEMTIGEITSVSYYFEGANRTAPSVIYMGETDTSQFAGPESFIPVANLTEVFNGNVTYSQGWVTITLDTPFEYTGTGNLVIAYLSNRGSWESRSFKATSTTNNLVCLAYTDSAPYDVNNIITGTTSYYYDITTLRPNVRFGMNIEGEFCDPVTDLSVSGITSEGATITWTPNENSTMFGVEYKASTDQTWTEATTNLTEASYTFTELSSLVEYQVKVYSICSGTVSQSKFASFSTLPSEELSIQAPYEQNFDNPETVINWNYINGTTNGWYVGTATNNTLGEDGELTSGGALYISEDNGATNTYDNYTSTYSYAWAYVFFPENTQNAISFDWKSNGESGCDYLRVYLLPVSESLPTTSSISTAYALTNTLGGSSSWRTVNVSLPFDYSGQAFKLVFAWRNDSSAGSNPPAAIDNLKISSTTCLQVQNISIETINNGSSATANVTLDVPGDAAVDYIVEYKEASATEWETIVTSEPTLSISDLLLSSVYQIRATTICTEDTAMISDNYTFTTPCVVVENFPYVESFEAFVAADGIIGNRVSPNCWYNVNGGYGYHYFTSSTTGAYTGQGCVSYTGTTSTDVSSYPASDWLISPIFSLTGAERLSFRLKLTYDYSAGVNPPAIEVYACDVSESDITSSADTSRFVLVGTLNHLTADLEYQYHELNLADYEADTRLALVVRRPTRSFNIDDFTIDEAPSCPEVHGVSATLLSINSVSLTFNTTNGIGSGWEVVYDTASSAANFDPTTAGYSLSVDSEDELPLIISDLEAGNTYYFAVRQSCDGGIFSTPVSVVVPTVEELPYEQNFDNLADVSEWVFETISGTANHSWAIGTATNNTVDESGAPTEGGALYMSTDGGATEGYISTTSSIVYATALVNLEGGASYTLSFDWKAGGEATSYDYLRVYLVPMLSGSAEDATYSLTSYLNIQTTWQHKEIELENYQDGIYKLVFRWKNDGSAGAQPGAAIDNIQIIANECAPVVSVLASAVAPTTPEGTPGINVSIVDNNTDATYILRYNESSSTELIEIPDLTAEQFPYYIADLAFATEYNIAVAAVCADGSPTEFVSTTATTICNFVTLPYYEQFDTDVLSGDCWTDKNGQLPASGSIQTSNLLNGSYWEYNTSATVDEQTTGKIKINIYDDEQYHWAMTPIFNLEEGTTYQIAFDVALTAYYSGNPVVYEQGDMFAVLVSTDAGTSWDMANATIFADGDDDTDHNWSSLNANFTRYYIELVDSEDNPISGLVRFAFYAQSEQYLTADNNLWIDNFAVEPYSTCITPSSLAVVEGSTTSSSVSISFNENGESTQWEYILAEGTTVDTETETPIAFSESDLPLTIQNLLELTDYTIAIRSVCGAGEYSSWSAPLTFATLMTATSIPYTCDFEEDGNNGWLLNNGTYTNKWYVGQLTSEDGTTNRALYVSDDNGLTAHYDITATSAVMAEKLFYTGFSDSLTFSVDISVEADIENSYYYDYVKVLWLPAELELTSSMVSPSIYDSCVVISNATGLDYDASSFRVVGNTNGTQTLTATIPNTPDTQRRLVFIWQNDNAYGTANAPIIDNISITETGDVVVPNPCNNPTDLMVTGVTENGAIIYWNGESETYEVKLNGGAAAIVNEPSITYTDLTPATDYTVEIRGVCAGTYSDWVSVQFTTLSGGTTVTAPTVTTMAATNVTQEAATLNGSVTAGTETVTAQGFEYQAQGAATWETVTVTGATLTTTLSGLTAETTYNYKAFATTASGNTYGAQMTFTTTAAPVEVVAPTVTTLAATEITVNGATLNGTITAGNEEITSQGFMYQAEGAAEWTTAEVEGENITLALTDLTAATTYSYKAFAITASGTVEGAVMSFTTLAGLADVANNGINAMLYPNPASDKATLSIEGLTESAQIVVSDAQGRILFNDTLNANTKTYELNVENYAAGVYYVRIISGQSISTQKLIVR